METLDFFVFFVIIAITSSIGLFSGRKVQSTSKDYFLAGGRIRWWGVAGSLFATNISSNQLVGMLGVGFSIGFAQSFYEFGAIPALLVLAYVLLPIYKRLGITTLSQYLENRFHPICSSAYSIILILLIIIQMTAALYIGSRATIYLLDEAFSYEMVVIALALICLLYTYHGGLETVVITDVIQSVLLLLAAVLLSYFTFASPDTISFWELVQNKEKMNIRLPADHPDLPFPGILSGLFILHLFYWSTNQYIVQRAIAAVDEKEARIGILIASFLKLIVPFVTITTGIAATSLFSSAEVLPDDTFAQLVKRIIPNSYGLKGLIAVGVFSAIVSSLDSMANSASTLFAFDIYGKYIRKNSKDSSIVQVGKYFILFVLGISVLLAIYTYSPKSGENFFIAVSEKSSYLTPGILAVFLAGITISKPSSRVAIWIMLLTPLFSILLERYYIDLAPVFITEMIGTKLNFLYRVLVSFTVAFLMLLLTRDRIPNRKAEESDAIIENRIRFIIPKKFKIKYSISFAFVLFFLFFYHIDVLDRFFFALSIGVTAFASFGSFRDGEKFLAGLLGFFTMAIFVYYI
ncbi:MAG: sodium/solute symporter [Leptospira sp.]|nr:sodium/solute symporter [Leptospira sp.]